MSLTSVEQLEYEIETASDPEVKEILQTKLHHVKMIQQDDKPKWNVEPMSFQDKLYFAIIVLGVLVLVGGVGYLGYLLVDYNSK